MKQYISVSTDIKIFHLTNQTKTAFGMVLIPFIYLMVVFPFENVIH